MKQLARVLLGLVAAAILSLPASIAAATVDPADRSTGRPEHTYLRVHPQASPIFLYDASPSGDQPGLPATSVTATFECPYGDFYGWSGAVLVQDGITYYPADTARGSFEVECAFTDRRKIRVGVLFSGPNLRPGAATVTFRVANARWGAPDFEATDTARVRIPAP